MGLRLCLICKNPFLEENIECCGISIRYAKTEGYKYPTARYLSSVEKKLLGEKEEPVIEPTPITERKSRRKKKHKLDDKLRQRILKRDKYKCTRCKSREYLQIHHIVYREKGGTDDPDNLTTLCEFCHADEHKDDPVYKIMRKGIV